MLDLGYSDNQVKIIDWEKEIDGNLQYKNKYSEIEKLYKSNEDFFAAVNETTGEVLKNSKKEIKDADSAIKTAAHYLLSEIAFMEFAT